MLSILIFILRHNDNPWREFGISRDEVDRYDINSDDIYNKNLSDPSDPWKEKQ